MTIKTDYQRWVANKRHIRAIAQARQCLLPLARAFWKETLGTTDGPSEEQWGVCCYNASDKGWEIHCEYYTLGLKEEKFQQACESGDTAALDRLLDVLLANVWLIKQDYEFTHRRYQSILRRVHKAGLLGDEQLRKHLAYELRELRVKEYHAMLDPQEQDRARARDRAMGARQYIKEAFDFDAPEFEVEKVDHLPEPKGLMQKLARRHALPEDFLQTWELARDIFMDTVLHSFAPFYPEEHEVEALPTDIPPTTPCYFLDLTGRKYQHAWSFCTWEALQHIPWHIPFLIAADASFYLSQNEYGGMWFHRGH